MKRIELRSLSLLGIIATVALISLPVHFVAAQSAGRKSAANEIDFIEQFSLAANRQVALDQLIPGTEDYYYYHCLHLQNLEKYDEVDGMLVAWIKAHKSSLRIREIQHRQALLMYAADPDQSLDYLKRHLKLQFAHQRAKLEPESNLPVQLDPKLISRESLVQRELSARPTLNGFDDSALQWLITTELTPTQRRQVLQRLTRPDHAQLPQLIMADLDFKGSKGFGSLPIHGMLLKAQLDTCLELKPALRNQSNFVQTYLARLQPHADVDWQNDVAEKRSYLDRMAAFTRTLNDVHNSLKAHVLYQQLVLDRSLGQYNKQRFMDYIKLPRQVSYVNRKYLALPMHFGRQADLATDFSKFTLHPPVGNDQSLVRSYLAHFFVAEADYKAYLPYLNDLFLKHLFAETKIVNGLGNAEQWYAMLPPAQYQVLKERVDIDFVPTNKQDFGVAEPVRLDLDIKNVSTLIVKVFELNSVNYYRENGREISTDINLDGLVANEERTFEYKEPALRRVRRHFEFPELNQQGTYVIDFIGNGESSRALVRKGRLRYVIESTNAGHRFTVLGDNNEHLRDAALLLGNKEYKADKDGHITVPYSNAPGNRSFLLTHARICSLHRFKHLTEEYELQAGFHVNRESLLPRSKTGVIVRPNLTINGKPTSLSVLEDVQLTIESTDQQGTVTTKTVTDFKLFEDRESVLEFQVPQRLKKISFQLDAKVQPLSNPVKVSVSDLKEFQLNEIDSTAQIQTVHLTQINGNYLLELLGKSGEAKSQRPVQVVLEHRNFKQPVSVTLQSNAGGRILLGPLPGIVKITAKDLDGAARTWPLETDHCYYPSLIHARQGESIQIPYLGKQAEPRRNEISLLEVRGKNFTRDHFESIRLEKGFWQLGPLPVGDYSLLLKQTNESISIRVTAGGQVGKHVVGNYRQLETQPLALLHIPGINVGDQEIQVQLGNASKYARLHVFASRYEPAYSAYHQMRKTLSETLAGRQTQSLNSLYAAGRNIGDEYQYIIDRKYQVKYPGNMLERPSVLLNPWVLNTTETTRQDAKKGEAFDDQDTGGMGEGFAGGGLVDQSGAAKSGGDFANLDFLPGQAISLVNLQPDEQGIVTIKREDLGTNCKLHVLAVDPTSAVLRTVSLPEIDTKYRDLRLANTLDSAKHFSQQKKIRVVPAGTPFVLPDVSTARFQVYDDLSKVYSLYATLSGDEKLAEFRFILGWPTLKDTEKRALYSKHACHELNFFLYHKDPRFFELVIQPYLANKKDATFVDHWLLNAKLAGYLDPWHHVRLNTLEQVLLGKHLQDESAHTLRAIRDRYQLLTPDLDILNELFDTALKGNALEEETEEMEAMLGLVEKQVEQKQGQMDKLRAAKPAAKNAGFADMGGGGYTAPATDRAADGKLSEEALAQREGLQDARKKVNIANGLRRNKKQDVEMFYAENDLSRKRVVQLYRKMEATKEWVENNYYQLPIEQQNQDLVKVNAFWNDYAGHQGKAGFVSSNFLQAAGNFTEMMAALAVMDLPFQAGEHETKLEKLQLTLKPGSPLVIFHQQIKESVPQENPVPILVSENFYRHGDRYRQEGNERYDKFITEEFLMHTVYGCQVVVTNPTSAPQKLDVLLQIPAGAMPVSGFRETTSMHVSLKPYHTTTFDYLFYFPAAGTYPHYPVHVSKEEQLLAQADPFTFKVLEKPSKIDRDNWAYISQFGTPEQVVEYLQATNLHRVALDRIAFRMQDKDFYEQVTKLLHQRHVYEPTLWSYSIQHRDVPRIREYLQHQDNFVKACGMYLESPLLSIDPVNRKTYQHRDYRPLVNARAHALGPRRQIVNQRFHTQYHQLLKILSYRRQLTDVDRLDVVYYMLLQDRIKEALLSFAEVNPENLSSRLQYDYFAGYLGFYTEQLEPVRAILNKYEDHPVDRWRKAFASMTNQLNELEGQNPDLIDPENRDQVQENLASRAASLNLAIEGKQVQLKYQQVPQVQVNYYLMDIELLFSRKPFVQHGSGQFSYIRPNVTEQIELPKDKTQVTFQLPEQLQNSNLLVEIRGAGQVQTRAYYANSLNVQTIQQYGHLQVTEAASDKPIPKTYVKVYAQLPNGKVRFYKDGYTDLRGRFDYSSVNTDDLDAVQKFAILILSPRYGSVIQEVAPPTR
jgi:hypothetical protein